MSAAAFAFIVGLGVGATGTLSLMVCWGFWLMAQAEKKYGRVKSH